MDQPKVCDMLPSSQGSFHYARVLLPQVGMKLHGGGFDEGVDIHEWEHWNP
jgi:hypothetical protein